MLLLLNVKQQISKQKSMPMPYTPFPCTPRIPHLVTCLPILEIIFEW